MGGNSVAGREIRKMITNLKEMGERAHARATMAVQFLQRNREDAQNAWASQRSSIFEKPESSKTNDLMWPGVIWQDV